jgi:hypothetical protein
MKISTFMRLAGSLIFTAVSWSVQEVRAQNAIQYLSSSTGYVLHRSGSNSATVVPWQGQKPITQFTGYGQIAMDGSCLTGATGNRALTWEGCRNTDPAQRWGFQGGRLRNERGWCADLEGGRSGPNVTVLAWNCSGAANQVWKAHYAVSASNVLPKVADAVLRQQLTAKIATAPAGQRIVLTPAEVAALRSAGAANIIGLDGATMVSAGDQKLIGLDGATFQGVGGRR